MKKKFKNIFKPTNWIVLFLSVLVISNIIFITRIIFNKPNVNQRINIPRNPKFDQSNQSDFFDSQCPDIEMVSIQGQTIKLTDFVGEVIVLRFTRLHLQDLPYLLFLEHLYNKFRNKGMHLFFINLLEKKYSISINKPVTFSVPLIEDDGYISSIFQARLNDTIITGKDFRIKFKNNQAANRIIYNQVIRYLFGDSPPPNPPSDKELESLLKGINFKNIKNGEVENLEVTTRNNSFLLTLFVSQCFGCPEHQRIELMRELASEIKKDKAQIILLFGKGNKFEELKKFSEQNDLIKYITIGIIEGSDILSEDDYYQIFDLNIDPRSFIFNKKGKILFAEGLKDQDKMNIHFLKKKLI